MTLPPVSLFHLGPPKTATTWLYQCLKEHPQISTSARDTIHYFDIHYALGESWYDRQFTTRDPAQKEVIRFDPTYSYICCPKAVERIARYNPAARLMYCLRNPVERAFSHYWHIKKQSGDAVIKFEDILTHYNNYATWMEHGLLAPGMKALYDHFPRSQIYAMLYEELSDNPEKIWAETVKLAGVDSAFRPSVLTKKVNVAGSGRGPFQRFSNKALRLVMDEDRITAMSKTSPLIRTLSGKGEYIQGIDPALERRLMEIVEPDIQDMERLSGMDLSHWRKGNGTRKSANGSRG